MKIVCSAALSYPLEAFQRLGETLVLDETAIGPDAVKDADALIVRSTTKVNSELLEGSRVRFVGTATIGSDHMDSDYLDSRGIAWSSAPGCNANSVCEYVIAALLNLAVKSGTTLEGLTLGIVGAGNIGSRLAATAASLGMKVLKNDPPRERAEGRGEFVKLERLVREADAVTMHVPLTREGPDATFHLADAGMFELMKGGIFINSSRGAVADNEALVAAMESGKVKKAVIDVWEGEPEYRRDLLDLVSLGTPHIAGYSFEGKAFGTMFVYEQLCSFLGVKPGWCVEDEFPPPEVPEVSADAAGKTDEELLHEVVSRVYDIEADDAKLRQKPGDPEHFRSLRRNYRVRREFRFTRANVENARPKLKAKLDALGFSHDSAPKS